MNLLIAGNSQAVRLMDTLEQGRAVVPDDWKVSFVLTPGGTGPYLRAKDGMLVEIRQNADFPVRCSPADALSKTIETYDAIVISALGYVDGGFRFDNPIYRRGTLSRFSPHKSEANPPPVSEACLLQTAYGMLNNHHGSNFLRSLRPAYTGRILVQQFPFLSADVRSRQDWRLKEVYADPEGMHAFLSAAATSWLEAICAEVDAQLLQPPSDIVVDGAYTAPRLMSETDHYHTTTEYAALVFGQVVSRLL